MKGGELVRPSHRGVAWRRLLLLLLHQPEHFPRRGIGSRAQQKTRKTVSPGGAKRAIMAADTETFPVGDEAMASKNEVDRPEAEIGAAAAANTAAPSGGETTAAAETADLPGGATTNTSQGDGPIENCDDKAADNEAIATNSEAGAAEAEAEAGAAAEHGLEQPSTAGEAPLDAPAETTITDEPAAAEEPVDAAGAQEAEPRTEPGDQAVTGSAEAGAGAVPAALAVDPDGSGGGKVTYIQPE